MEYLTIGFCLDYISEYQEASKPKDKKEKSVRNASQSDFDNF